MLFYLIIGLSLKKLMFIKNLKEVAKNRERKIILEIIEAGLAAIQPEKIINSRVKFNCRKNLLQIDNYQLDLTKIRRIFVFGVGKASFKSVQSLEKILGSRINDGVVIDTHPKKLKYVRTFQGTHPLPSRNNYLATRELEKMVDQAGKDDLVIGLITGGGSALLCDYRVKLTELRKIFIYLLKSGANIEEINTIRKHFSQIHGGWLAKRIYPARGLSLIISDVPSNNLSFIASGPTYPDKTTLKDARQIINQYNLSGIKYLINKMVETPKEKKYFRRIKNILIGDNRTALQSMADLARKKRIKKIEIKPRGLKGEAYQCGSRLIRLISKKKPSTIILLGGETGVTVKGSGVGGRNQELALGAVKEIKPGVILAAFASDGRDNIELAAGAIIDYSIKEKIKQINLSPDKFLTNNDSYHFFKQTNDLIITGPLDSNVSDLAVIYKS